MSKLPTPDEVDRRSEYEVDQSLAESADMLMRGMDAGTQKLLRDVMILSWRRGAAWVIGVYGAKVIGKDE